MESCFLTLFADDTSALITSDKVSTLSTVTNSCVQSMSSWCQSNGLVLNSSKTNFMLFKPIGTNIDRSILVKSDKGSIKQQNEVKFLGLWMDSHLSWECHINHLSKTLASKNYLVKQLRSSVNTSTLKTLYFGTVQSVLSYGLVCWGNCTGISKIFIMQKRIIRTMFNIPFLSSCRPIFKNNRILTLHCLYIYQCLCFVRKNIDQFPKCKDVNMYCTRQANDIYVTPYRLSQVGNGPIITAIKIYNHLPNELRALASFNQFKDAVKVFLIDQVFYSLDEYFKYR